jgi:hypothetical protein
MQDTDTPFGAYSVDFQANDGITIPHVSAQTPGTSSFTLQYWGKSTDNNSNQNIFYKGGSTQRLQMQNDTRTTTDRVRMLIASTGNDLNYDNADWDLGNWMMVHGVRRYGVDREIYTNGTSRLVLTNNNTLNCTASDPPLLGTSTAGFKVREIRYRQSALSDDWITTEYNNQNDNAAFWVATSAGGGGGVTRNAIFAFGGM